MTCWSIPQQGFNNASVGTGNQAAGGTVDFGEVRSSHACQIVINEGTAGATQVYLNGSLDGENFYSLTPVPYYTGDGASGVKTGLLAATGAARYVQAYANQLTEWGGCTGLTTLHASSD